jgi:hypothetical protein
MPGDIEKAKRELRFAKSTADDKRWDQLEPKLQAIDAALEGVPDAEKAPVAAEVAAMREKMLQGIREEKAGRLEREIKRNLSAAADDLNRGYDESPQIPKTIARLESAEAKEVLSPQTIAAFQAEIAALQAKSKKAAPPPPKAAPPAPAASADVEKARRELRFAKSTADEKRWDQLEPRLQAVEAALAGVPDPDKAPIAAEVAALREKMLQGIREEKAGPLEREIKRNLSAAADDLNRGYDESPQIPKTIARLESAEAKEVLSAQMIAAFQAEIAALQARSKKAAPPPPNSATTPAATPKPATSPAAPAPPPVENEKAKLIENDIARTLRFAADELGRNPQQGGSGLARAAARLDSDEARENLPPATMERLRAQLVELQAKVDAAAREDKVRTLEGFIDRYIRQGESDLGHNRRGAENMLRHAAERLEKDDAKDLLSAASVARFRSEIARVEGLVAEAGKKDAFDRALPLMKELEDRVAKPIFDDSQPAWKALGDLDSLKSRVRGALSELSRDDADVKKLEKRIAAVDAKISTATAKLGRDEAHDRVQRSWEFERQAVAGWEQESGGDKASPTYEMPKTALAVRRLTWFLNDKDLQNIAEAHKEDKPIQALMAEARKIREAAIGQLHAAYNALLAHLEKQPRPSNRFDLEKPSHLAGQAGGDFEGTPHHAANHARAKALGDRWEKEIEAERKARQATYDELSAKAAAAWPKILSGMQAEKEFDPQEPGSKGKTVLIEGLRNRIGWDFSGAFDFAIWVHEIPVVGNYDKAVLAAMNEACEKTGLSIDDHTDWDAVIVVGGPGRIKLRTEIIVRDRGNLEIGKIEEWRPVDAVTCKVIALRAGPAAAGPKG